MLSNWLNKKEWFLNLKKVIRAKDENILATRHLFTPDDSIIDGVWYIIRIQGVRNYFKKLINNFFTKLKNIKRSFQYGIRSVKRFPRTLHLGVTNGAKGFKKDVVHFFYYSIPHGIKRIPSWPKRKYERIIFLIGEIQHWIWKIFIQQNNVRKYWFFRILWIFSLLCILVYLALSFMDEMKFYGNTLDPWNEWYYVTYERGTEHYLFFWLLYLMFWFLSFYFVSIFYYFWNYWLTGHIYLLVFCSDEYSFILTNFLDVWAVNYTASWYIINSIASFYINVEAENDEFYEQFVYRAYNHPDISEFYKLDEKADDLDDMKNEAHLTTLLLLAYGGVDGKDGWIEPMHSWETLHFKLRWEYAVKHGLEEEEVTAKAFYYEWKAYDQSNWEATKVQDKVQIKLGVDDFSHRIPDYGPVYERLQEHMDETKLAQRLKIHRLRGRPDDEFHR